MQQLQRGETTAATLLAACRHAAEQYAGVNALLGSSLDSWALAEAQAKASDARRAAGCALHALDGIPLVIKDNFCQAGQPVSCASRMLEHFVAPYDAAVVARLRELGAVLVGRGNMDEFGMGSASRFSYFGAVRNPLDPLHTAGGSSGGSAAAVAAGMCLGYVRDICAKELFAQHQNNRAHVFWRRALGSDTGGSVRLPAAYCGLVGLKPSYGWLSRLGLIAYASSLDCPAILADTVGDAALLLRALRTSASEVQDETVVSVVNEPTVARHELAALRVGIPREYADMALSRPMRTAWATAIDRLAAAGASVELVSLPHSAAALAAYYVIASAEASSNLARYDGIRFGAPHPPIPNLVDLSRLT